MKPTKAYILRIDTLISKEYAKCAADSCDNIGLPWEYFEGFTDEILKNNGKGGGYNPWPAVRKAGVEFSREPNTKGPPACATAGHILIWKKIVDNNECAIVLEHDALMFHKVDIDIPDDALVALGYKVKDPKNYNSQKAGPPKALEERAKHGGAHAYALNAKTAKSLLGNIKQGKRVNHIDNQFFLTGNSRGDVKLYVTDPIAGIGWLRESTIWGKSAVDNYQPILDSFKNNYDSNEPLGEKKGGAVK